MAAPEFDIELKQGDAFEYSVDHSENVSIRGAIRLADLTQAYPVVHRADKFHARLSGSSGAQMAGTHTSGVSRQGSEFEGVGLGRPLLHGGRY